MRPILITDCDEVLVYFVRPFMDWLEEQGYRLSLDSFRLAGNVRRIDTGEPADQATVSRMVDQFFEDRVEACPLVEDAAETLREIATVADIIILTNVPAAQRERRQAALTRLGLPYPVIANAGLKGERVKTLAASAGPCLFIDDIPHHHSSVASVAPHVQRLHFVADPRLQTLIPAAEDAHHRIDSWAQVLPVALQTFAGLK